jgi:hypothetical protein
MAMAVANAVAKTLTTMAGRDSGGKGKCDGEGNSSNKSCGRAMALLTTAATANAMVTKMAAMQWQWQRLHWLVKRRWGGCTAMMMAAAAAAVVVAMETARAIAVMRAMAVSTGEARAMAVAMAAVRQQLIALDWF